MSERRAIRLTVPGQLRYRDVAVRAVAAACRLVGDEGAVPSAAAGAALDLTDAFDAEMVSAFSEIFNNIAIHAYGESRSGDVTIELVPARDHLLVKITDQGGTFDLAAVPTPELESLPEGGMGIHIARACTDRLDYQPGPPNVWQLTKFTKPAHDAGKRPRATTSQG